MEKIEGETFEMNDKCYQYDYQHQSCSSGNAKIVDFSRASAPSNS